MHKHNKRITFWADEIIYSGEKIPSHLESLFSWIIDH